MWFIDKEGQYVGELNDSCWLGDAADGKSLLFKDSTQRVIKLTPSLHVSARSFAWESGKSATPLALYDDLKFGFFLDESGQVTLAKW